MTGSATSSHLRRLLLISAVPASDRSEGDDSEVKSLEKGSVDEEDPDPSFRLSDWSLRGSGGARARLPPPPPPTTMRAVGRVLAISAGLSAGLGGAVLEGRAVQGRRCRATNERETHLVSHQKTNRPSQQPNPGFEPRPSRARHTHTPPRSSAMHGESAYQPSHTAYYSVLGRCLNTRWGGIGWRRG